MQFRYTAPPVSSQKVFSRTVKPAFPSVQRCSVMAAASKAAERVKLGDSDLQISACTLGTMTWGQQNTEAEGIAQLNWAFDRGINTLDTAEMYPIPTKADTQGRTDKTIGSWLKGRKREDVVILSKVSGYTDTQTWVRDPPVTVRVTPKQIKESVDASLKRLGTDHLDLLQVHWPDRYVPLFGRGPYDPKLERKGDIPIEESLRGLQDVIQSGKVRYVGVSNETSYGVSEYAHLALTKALPKIVSIQNSYSLIVRTGFETDLAEMCRRHNVGLLAYSPLGGGSLTGKYNVANPDPKARLNLFMGYMSRYKDSLVQQAVAAYEQVAAKHGLTATELALAWCHSRWFVTSTIIGATSLEQLAENVNAFDKQLSQAAIDDVNTVHKKFRDPSLM